MKGWQLGTLAVVVVVGGGVAAAPIFIGKQAEQGFREQLSRLNQPGAVWQVERYDRGWLGANAVSRLELEGEDGPIVMEFDHTITHGPFATAGLYEMVSYPRFTGDTAEAANFYFPENNRISSHFKVKFDGSHTFDLEIPAYRGPVQGEEAMQIDWSGLRGQLRGTEDHAEGELTEASFKLEATDPQGSIVMNGLHGRLSANRTGGLWYGDSEFGIRSFQLRDPGGESNIDLGEAGVKAYQRLEADGIMGGISFNARDLKAAGYNIGQAGYTLEFSRFDPAVFLEIQARSEALSKAQLSPEEMQLEAQKLMFEMLPQLLAKKPSMAIKDLVVETPEGRLEGHLDVNYVGEGMPNPMAFVTAVKATGELTMPRAMFEQFTKESQREEMASLLEMQAALTAPTEGEEAAEAEAPAPDLEAELQAYADQQVEQLLALGVVTQEGEMLKSNALFEGGKVYVNGELMMDMLGGM